MNIWFYPITKEYFLKLTSRAMLILPLLFCFACIGVRADVLNQTKPTGNISLKLTEASIYNGLALLETKAGCVINYNRSIFKENIRITIDVRDLTLSQVLTKMLANTHVGFKMADAGTVLLYKLPDPAKPGKISGKVLDEKGEPLPGASIRVVGQINGAQTGVDGSYIISLLPGTYSLEVTYISYQTQRITGVVVTENKSTPLDISLNPSSSALNEVVVTASYRKASVEGLLARQKNAAEISNGISAEQLARTPDKNIGESLKRISGVSTIDNKFVLVRGIGERYNSAMLDGTVLPSTEAQSRNFSFDMIPSSLVDNVVVSKTVTPDMNVSFGGGLIQINTKDIPNENFMSFTAGTSYNDQSTGKDFLSHKRGKYDYFGFDDGNRDFPQGLQHTVRTVAPNITLTDAEFQKKVEDQSRRFTHDNFTVYKYKAAPSQNYQFTIGRLISLDTVKNNKLGFTGALSYRNNQNINVISHEQRSDWNPNYNNNGAAYDFNTTWGALLNVGLQLGKNRFSLRNTYTRVFDNTLVRLIGYQKDQTVATDNSIPPGRIQEVDDPTFTNLLQNKLNGQHQLGKVKIEWDIARTSINREEKDLSIAESAPELIGSQYQYFYKPGISSQPQINPMSRHYYENKEKHYSWDLSATVPFILANIRSSVKAGYFGNRKKASFDWEIAPFTISALPGSNFPDSLKYLPVGEMLKPQNIGKNGFIYSISEYQVDSYEGKSQSHAGYIMFDNRLLDKLRLVWGVRADYYKYTEIRNGKNIALQVYSIKPDPRWQWLPSANLTYSPISSLNIRVAYSSSVVRPELMDNSQFWRYSPYLGALYGNQGLYSTRINSIDLKTEWFPGLGEIISIGGFYKRFNKPAELTLDVSTGNNNYYLKSSDWAKVYGLEFELRKNLSFIADADILRNLTVYGNLTLQRSDVKSTYLAPNPEVGKPDLVLSTKQNRAMYGQTPYLINAGLQYTGEHFGFNFMYNKSGYKTYIVSDRPSNIEYEKPREQIDAQISYRLLKKRMEIRINAGNLLNAASTFYRNTASYENNPAHNAGSQDISDVERLKPGFSNKYENGDLVTFGQKFGRTYSTSITYTF